MIHPMDRLTPEEDQCKTRIINGMCKLLIIELQDIERDLDRCIHKAQQKALIADNGLDITHGMCEDETDDTV